jgi:amino acid permease
MKVALQFFAATLFGHLLISSGCKKSDNSNEASVAATATPASGSVLAALVGLFYLSVTIISAMPPA